MSIRLKRVYQEPSDEDGKRVLVDRLWPRGISKERGAISVWMRDIAPTNELRKWFAHDPRRWEEFRRRYFEELDNNEGVERLLKMVEEGDVTLLYAAKDTEHNNASALRDYLNSRTR